MENKRYISILYCCIGYFKSLLSIQPYLITNAEKKIYKKINVCKVTIRKQLVLQSSEFSECVCCWCAGPQNTVSTVYSQPLYSSLTQGVYAGHGHKLPFLAMTFINFYKYDSCCFFFFSRHGK